MGLVLGGVGRYCLSKASCLHTHSSCKGREVFLHYMAPLSVSVPLCVTRYDEEQAQSENAERDLRSRSGQSLGSKGTKGSAGVRPAAATWK